jgi:hypothetical protein
MKVSTPPSYSKIYEITNYGTNDVIDTGTRGLLITTTSVGSITVETSDGKQQQIQNIPANTVFVLPISIVKLKAINSTSTTKVYALL